MMLGFDFHEVGLPAAAHTSRRNCTPSASVVTCSTGFARNFTDPLPSPIAKPTTQLRQQLMLVNRVTAVPG